MIQHKKQNGKKKPADDHEPTELTVADNDLHKKPTSTIGKYDQAKIANIIAGVAVTVSIFLAVFTYSLFKQASTQTQAANRSASASVTADSIANNSYHLSDSIYKATDTSNKRTFDETKHYNDNFLKAQQKAFVEAKKDADIREKRDSIAFQQTKKQFEIENRPYLQIVNVNIDTLEKGKPFYISYYLNNFGKFPANVLLVKTQITYSTNTVYEIPISFDKYTNIKTNFYVSNGVSQKLYTNGIDTLPKLFVDQYNNGKISLFFFGLCEFINPITNKKFIYKFKDRINNKPSFTIEVQENTVTEEK